MNAIEILHPVGAIDASQAAVRQHVGLRAADALLCLHAGALAPEGEALRGFYQPVASSPQLVAAAGAATIRMTEWDDIHVASCVTAGAVAVPAALAFAPSDERFVEAVCAGYAIGIGLGTAIGGVRALPDTWPGLLAASAIAAVTTATALGLSLEQRAHALVMALAGASGRNGRPSGFPSARWLSIGEATLKGVRAAHAAAHGYKGDLDLLSAQWLKAQNPEALGWGQLDPMAIASSGLKPFVAARQGMNAIVAFERLLEQGLDLDEIAEIDVAVPSEAVPVLARPLQTDYRLSRIAHLGLQFAQLALDPASAMDVRRDGPIGAPVLAFASRVRISADARLPQLSREWPARVRALYRDEWLEETFASEPSDLAHAYAIIRRKRASLETLSAGSIGVFDALVEFKPGVHRKALEVLSEFLNGGAMHRP